MGPQLRVEPPCAPMLSDFVPFWLRAAITTLVVLLCRQGPTLSAPRVSSMPHALGISVAHPPLKCCPAGTVPAEEG